MLAGFLSAFLKTPLYVSPLATKKVKKVSYDNYILPGMYIHNNTKKKQLCILMLVVKTIVSVIYIFMLAC